VEKEREIGMSNKGHCKYSDYGKCTLPENEGEKCVGYEYCDEYEDKE